MDAEKSELVKRLRAGLRVNDGSGGVIETVDGHLAETTLDEAADRIEALKAENEQLRLTMMGGEDAPGYAASVPLDDLILSFEQDRRAQSAYSEQLFAENERLIAAIHWALGYTNFRERGEREGAYWWRKEIRQRANIDEKIEQLDAALPHP